MPCICCPEHRAVRAQYSRLCWVLSTCALLPACVEGSARKSAGIGRNRASHAYSLRDVFPRIVQEKVSGMAGCSHLLLSGGLAVDSRCVDAADVTSSATLSLTMIPSDEAMGRAFCSSHDTQAKLSEKRKHHAYKVLRTDAGIRDLANGPLRRTQKVYVTSISRAKQGNSCRAANSPGNMWQPSGLT